MRKRETSIYGDVFVNGHRLEAAPSVPDDRADAVLYGLTATAATAPERDPGEDEHEDLIDGEADPGETAASDR